MHKYRPFSGANNLEFQPLVFKTTGRFEKETLSFIKKLIGRMSRGDSRMLTIYLYFWIGRISCCLQKNMANAIIHRLSSINGALTSVSNYEFGDRFVFENHIVH